MQYGISSTIADITVLDEPCRIQYLKYIDYSLRTTVERMSLNSQQV